MCTIRLLRVKACSYTLQTLYLAPLRTCNLFQRNLHEDRIVVGITQLLHVVVDALKILVMEDVVDTQWRLAAQSVHPSAATLLESVGEFALQRVVNV